MTTNKQNLNSAKTLECPICNAVSSYVFTSKHNRKIYECPSTDCGHFFTPQTTGEQGICVRDENIEKESDQSIALFNERNYRLLNLFVGVLDKKIIQSHLWILALVMLTFHAPLKECLVIKQEFTA